MLERDLTDRAGAFRILHVVVFVQIAGDAQPLERAAERQRTKRAADLERLLVVRLGLAVTLAVVEAGVNVSVAARRIPVERGAGVGRREEAFAVLERRSLETVAVDAFVVVDERRLMHAQADPRSLVRPVVEVELAVRVLEAERVRAAQRAAGTGLAGDVGRD